MDSNLQCSCLELDLLAIAFVLKRKKNSKNQPGRGSTKGRRNVTHTVTCTRQAQFSSFP